MGFVRQAVQRAGSTSSSSLSQPASWVEDWFAGGGATSLGPWVSESTALHYSPFFAAVNAISTDVGKLPLPVYQRLKPTGKQKARDHPLYGLLVDQPNPLMAPIVFKRTLQAHAMTWGTGFAHLTWNDRGVLTEMWPLRPDRMKPEKTYYAPGKFKLMWRYSDPVNGIYTRFHADEVLNIGGLGFDGVCGYSIVAMARQSLALGLAAERYGAAFFANGGRPGGVLKHPKTVSDPARKRMSADWDNLHRGIERAHKIAILEEGVDYQAIGIPPEDAQFLETRQLQVTEATRWTRIQPHKIGDLQHATFSNIEHQGLEYVTDTLGGWLVTWEQMVNMRCLTSLERRRYFVENIVEAMLRGDLKSRMEAYAIARNWGLLNADDIAELENRNPLPDKVGQTYLVPLNMQPAMPPGAPDAAPERAGRCPQHPGCTCNTAAA